MSDNRREPGERPTGYYWIKYSGQWIIAIWQNEHAAWYYGLKSLGHSDSDFEEIDERPIVREVK